VIFHSYVSLRLGYLIRQDEYDHCNITRNDVVKSPSLVVVDWWVYHMVFRLPLWVAMRPDVPWSPRLHGAVGGSSLDTQCLGSSKANVWNSSTRCSPPRQTWHHGHHGRMADPGESRRYQKAMSMRRDRKDRAAVRVADSKPWREGSCKLDFWRGFGSDS